MSEVETMEKRLQAWHRWLDDSRYELNALPSQRQGTLAGLLDFVGQ